MSCDIFRLQHKGSFCNGVQKLDGRVLSVPNVPWAEAVRIRWSSTSGATGRSPTSSRSRQHSWLDLAFKEGVHVRAFVSKLTKCLTIFCYILANILLTDSYMLTNLIVNLSNLLNFVNILTNIEPFVNIWQWLANIFAKQINDYLVQFGQTFCRTDQLTNILSLERCRSA